MTRWLVETLEGEVSFLHPQSDLIMLQETVWGGSAKDSSAPCASRPRGPRVLLQQDLDPVSKLEAQDACEFPRAASQDSQTAWLSQQSVFSHGLEAGSLHSRCWGRAVLETAGRIPLCLFLASMVALPQSLALFGL